MHLEAPFLVKVRGHGSSGLDPSFVLEYTNAGSTSSSKVVSEFVICMLTGIDDGWWKDVGSKKRSSSRPLLVWVQDCSQNVTTFVEKAELLGINVETFTSNDAAQEWISTHSSKFNSYDRL